MGSKNTILIGVLVLLAAVAVWRLTSGGEDSKTPDTPESVTHWMCAKCGKVYTLTAREFEEWDATRSRHKDGLNQKQTVFLCDACNEYAVVRAFKCKIHDCWYYEVGPDGTPSDCPKCLEEDRGN